MKTSKVNVSLQKFSVSDRDILNKKVNTNKKYLNVKPRIRSGYTAKDKEELEYDIKKYYKIKLDEVFRRISLINLMQLMVSYVNEHEEVAEGVAPDFKSPEKRSQTHLLEASFNAMPFLIVDVRQSQDFRTSHIACAINHPSTKMGRTVGWECQELLAYKNHPDWIIVIYDEKENVAPDVVTTFIHRGYDNVFMLSGGLQLAVDKIGPPFVTSESSRVVSASLVEFLCGELTFLSGLCLTSRDEQSECSSVNERIRSASKAETVKSIPWR